MTILVNRCVNCGTVFDLGTMHTFFLKYITCLAMNNSLSCQTVVTHFGLDSI